MSALSDEIDHNAGEFAAGWQDALVKNFTSLQDHVKLKESYRRICAYQALRSQIVDGKYSKGSAAFFYESHNDLLISHVTANYGAWRSSLHSLRSAIENSLCAAFYNDHPVEMQRWMIGDFRIGFSELLTYFSRHPKVQPVDKAAQFLNVLSKEYSTLSKAVHASASNFRMTEGASKILLWSTDETKLNMWSTRERQVVRSIPYLFCTLHSDDFTGTKNTPVRETLSFAFTSVDRKRIREILKITISPP